MPRRSWTGGLRAEHYLQRDYSRFFCLVVWLFALIWGWGRMSSGYSKGQAGMPACPVGICSAWVGVLVLAGGAEGGGSFLFFSLLFILSLYCSSSLTLVHEVITHWISTYYVSARSQASPYRIWRYIRTAPSTFHFTSNLYAHLGLSFFWLFFLHWFYF